LKARRLDQKHKTSGASGTKLVLRVQWLLQRAEIDRGQQLPREGNDDVNE
jgi:hypothetical protein